MKRGKNDKYFFFFFFRFVLFVYFSSFIRRILWSKLKINSAHNNFNHHSIQSIPWNDINYKNSLEISKQRLKHQMFELNTECTLIDLWFKFQKTEDKNHSKLYKIKKKYFNFIPYANNIQTSNYTQICGTNNRPTHWGMDFSTSCLIRIKTFPLMMSA